MRRAPTAQTLLRRRMRHPLAMRPASVGGIKSEILISFVVYIVAFWGKMSEGGGKKGKTHRG